MEAAACRGKGSTIFFPDVPVGAGSSRNLALYAAAKAVCDTCTVTAQCLAYCLPFEKETGRHDGMYGGRTPQERAAMLPGNPIRFRT